MRITLMQALRDIDASASDANRFGHKMLAVCYGVILFQIGLSVYLG
jgi:hypothetical protein